MNMRKLLLAATAVAGMTGLVAGQAQAQMADQPLTTSNFSSTASGNQPAPGTVTVRIKAALWVEGSYGTDSGQKVGTSKNSGVLLGSYMRIYPSFDGVTANGVQYGATTEVRMNSGGLGNTGGGSSSNPGNSLFMRRGNGYVGTPALGRLYFGPENDALARQAAGSTMEDFDYNGGFNGDFPTGQSSVTAPNFAFMRASNQYTANKLVYLSPAFAGFTFGASFAPSWSTGDLQCGAAGSTANCSQLSSVAGGNSAPKNVYDLSVGYAGSFGPVALKAFAGYLGSGHVIDSTAGITGAAQYKNLSVGAAGGRVTIGPFAMGGQVNFGQENANGGNGLIRQGQKNATNIVAGAQYTIGTVIMGFQYINELSGGNYSSNPLYTRSQLHEQGIAIGGAWDWAPGATLYGSMAYSQRHQYGWNFVAGSGNTNVGNSVQARIIQIGNVFHW
jgi:hypothetical protein